MLRPPWKPCPQKVVDDAVGHKTPTPAEGPTKTPAANVPDQIAKTGCFAAGTSLLTPEGSKSIELFRPGDLVLARSEHDVEGAIEPKRVVDTFVRVAPVLELHVGGQAILTTGEHPFYVVNHGWRGAAFLHPGDLLCSHDGSLHPVDRINDTREVTTVYNVEVEDYHTYFLGCQEWGFSVWAHNAACVEFKDGFWRVTAEGQPTKLFAASEESLARAHAAKLDAALPKPVVAVPAKDPIFEGATDLSRGQWIPTGLSPRDQHIVFANAQKAAGTAGAGHKLLQPAGTMNRGPFAKAPPIYENWSYREFKNGVQYEVHYKRNSVTGEVGFF